MIVVITGASGYIGTRLLKRLTRDNAVEKIVALDVRHPSIQHEKITFHHRDIRDGLFPLLKKYRPQTVFHLAFMLNPMHNVREMFKINVEGTCRAILDCEKARVKRFIYPSSATAYGASPHNPIPIPESFPVDPHIRFSYARHKAKIEVFLKRYQKKSQMSFLIFRPVVVFGPHVNNFISQGIEGPVLVSIKSTQQPPLQLVHEEDAAEAFYYGFKQNLEGFYNVSADGTITFDEGAKLFGRRPKELPYPLVYAINSLLWQLKVFKAPPQYLDFVRFPWIVDNTKLKKAGFQYKYTTRETFIDYLKGKRKFSTNSVKPFT